MRHKEIGVFIAIIPVVIIGVVASVFLIKSTLDKQASEKKFLEPFHEIYDTLSEKYSFIKSFSEKVGASGCYGMYYLICDIADDSDCFAELVDVQREINALMEARKDDQWFNSFTGHIEIIANNRRVRVFYSNGSMSKEIWANDVISDDYSVLWDAFPENDEIFLVIFLTDYSDEIKSEITQKYEGRNIIVRHQIGAD